MIIRMKLIVSLSLVMLMLLAAVACVDKSEDTPEGSNGSDITITASGLQYIEIEAGEGVSPQRGDVVAVHYTGTLEDGTQFDSSVERGMPITFASGMGQMIPGFDEGVALMKEGGKARLVIPPELGYGDVERGTIPAGSTLIFEVELISVIRPDPPTEVAETEYKTTASGLKYYDIEIGGGELPEDGQTVFAHYTIWLDDGARIESTLDAGNPAPFFIDPDQLIPGIYEGMENIRVGGMRQLVVPPDLAFGEEGVPGIIPPNATLTFELDIMAVIPVPEPSERTVLADEDYQVTESGLKYYDLVEGKGLLPEPGQTVVVHYTGWLEDGSQFDSSIDRGDPLFFPLGTGQMIPGFEEGVSTMKVGGKRQLILAPELAYGVAQEGGALAGQTLIFEVELFYVY